MAKIPICISVSVYKILISYIFSRCFLILQISGQLGNIVFPWTGGRLFGGCSWVISVYLTNIPCPLVQLKYRLPLYTPSCPKSTVNKHFFKKKSYYYYKKRDVLKLAYIPYIVKRHIFMFRLSLIIKCRCITFEPEINVQIQNMHATWMWNMNSSKTGLSCSRTNTNNEWCTQYSCAWAYLHVCMVKKVQMVCTFFFFCSGTFINKW